MLILKLILNCFSNNFQNEIFMFLENFIKIINMFFEFYKITLQNFLLFNVILHNLLNQSV